MITYIWLKLKKIYISFPGLQIVFGRMNKLLQSFLYSLFLLFSNFLCLVQLSIIILSIKLVTMNIEHYTKLTDFAYQIAVV